MSQASVSLPVKWGYNMPYLAELLRRISEVTGTALSTQLCTW